MNFSKSKALQACKGMTGKHTAVNSTAHITVIIQPGGTIAQYRFSSEMIINFGGYCCFMKIGVLNKAVAFVCIIPTQYKTPFALNKTALQVSPLISNSIQLCREFQYWHCSRGMCNKINHSPNCFTTVKRRRWAFDNLYIFYRYHI